MRSNFKKYIKKTFLVLIISISFFSFGSYSAYAEDFNISSNFDIYLEEIRDNTVRVEKELNISTNNPDYYIPANTKQTITIPAIASEATRDAIELKKNTLNIQDNQGRNLNHDVTQSNNTLVVSITLPHDISQQKSFSANISYKSKDFINQNGNISNLYLPGLHEETRFEEIDTSTGLKTSYQYNMTYHVPLDAPQPSFISPESIYSTQGQKYRKYHFSQEQRLNNTGWIQLGTEQYYYFEINQEIPQRNTSKYLDGVTNFFSTNLLEMTLPKEFQETNQQVFIKSIDPKPTYIRLDNEENIISVFDMDKIDKKNIKIRGYIKLSSQEVQDLPEIDFDNYFSQVENFEHFERYTQADKYWESNDPEITELAKRIKNENKDGGILNIINEVYYFVIENLSYSHEKAAQENPRLGALSALRGKPSVCMEYADLMIAILRAQNIPARAAMGYGNDPHLNQQENNLAAETGHQWVQIWLPNYGWLSADPTWGETDRKYIGGDLDHVLWYTEGNTKEKISKIMIYSSREINQQIFDLYNITVIPKHHSDVPELQNLKTIQTLVDNYEKEEEEILSKDQSLQETIQDSTAGRALVFALPAIIILIASIVVVIVISKIIKSKRT